MKQSPQTMKNFISPGSNSSPVIGPPLSAAMAGWANNQYPAAAPTAANFVERFLVYDVTHAGQKLSLHEAEAGKSNVKLRIVQNRHEEFRDRE